MPNGVKCCTTMEVDGTRQELSSEAELVALCQEQYEQLGLVLTSQKSRHNYKAQLLSTVNTNIINPWTEASGPRYRLKFKVICTDSAACKEECLQCSTLLAGHQTSSL